MNNNKLLTLILLFYFNTVFSQDKNSKLDKIFYKAYSLVSQDNNYAAIKLIDSTLTTLKNSKLKKHEAKLITLKGVVYSQLYEFNTAEKLYLKAMSTLDSINEVSSYNWTYSLLVQDYMLNNNLDKYYENLPLLKERVKGGYMIFYTYITEMMVLYDKKKYSELIKKTNQSLKKIKIKDTVNELTVEQWQKEKAIYTSIYTMFKAFSLIELKDDSIKADNLLNTLKDINFNEYPWNDEKKHKYKADIYLYKYKYFSAIKNLDSAGFYHEKYVDLNKETLLYFEGKIKKNRTVVNEVLKNEKNILKSNLSLEIQNEQIKKMRYFAISILVLVVLIALFFYSYVLFKTSKRMKIINKMVRVLNTQLEDKNVILKQINDKNKELITLNERNIFAKTVQISTIRDKVKKIKGIINSLTENDTTVKVNQLYAIENSLESIITENEIWNDFKIQFENTRPDFFKKLKIINSKLTINDLKHCAYLVTNLGVKEVASLVYLSPRSVETTRYRLSKKLNVPTKVKLYDFLNDLA